jgi:hypothetical protein
MTEPLSHLLLQLSSVLRTYVDAKKGLLSAVAAERRSSVSGGRRRSSSLMQSGRRRSSSANVPPRRAVVVAGAPLSMTAIQEAHGGYETPQGEGANPDRGGAPAAAGAPICHESSVGADLHQAYKGLMLAEALGPVTSTLQPEGERTDDDGDDDRRDSIGSRLARIRVPSMRVVPLNEPESNSGGHNG